MNANHSQDIRPQPFAQEAARQALARVLTSLKGSWEYHDLLMRSDAEVGASSAGLRGWNAGYRHGLDQAIWAVQDRAEQLDLEDPAKRRTAERATEERETLGDRVVIALHNENGSPGSSQTHYRITRRGHEAERITASYARARQAAAPAAAPQRSAGQRAHPRAQAPAPPCLQREEADRER